MDKRWLAIAVAMGLMAGCNSNNKNSVTTNFAIQAYDGPVWGMDSKAICDDGQTYSGTRTLHSGYAFFEDAYPRDNPENCSFEFGDFTGDDRIIIDTTNSKDMSKVSYKTPKGMFTSGQSAAASPLSTLITIKLAEDGVDTYDLSTASQVLSDLGLGNVQDVDAFLKKPEAEIAKLKTEDPATFKRAIAVTAVASDVVQSLDDDTVSGQADTFDKVLNLTNNLADGLEASDTFNELIESDKPITTSYVDTIKDKAKEGGLGDALEEGTTIPSEVIDGGVSEGEVVPEPEDPTEPTPPGTGGTGGTGGSGGTGGTGGGNGN